MQHVCDPHNPPLLTPSRWPPLCRALNRQTHQELPGSVSFWGPRLVNQSGAKCYELDSVKAVEGHFKVPPAASRPCTKKPLHETLIWPLCELTDALTDRWVDHSFFSFCRQNHSPLNNGSCASLVVDISCIDSVSDSQQDFRYELHVFLFTTNLLCLCFLRVCVTCDSDVLTFPKWALLPPSCPSHSCSSPNHRAPLPLCFLRSRCSIPARFLWPPRRYSLVRCCFLTAQIALCYNPLLLDADTCLTWLLFLNFHLC